MKKTKKKSKKPRDPNILASYKREIDLRSKIRKDRKKYDRKKEKKRVRDLLTSLTVSYIIYSKQTGGLLNNA